MTSNSVSKNQKIEEAGGFIDRNILSRLGSRRSRKSAETRVLDQNRADQLWDAYLEVTGGGDKFELRELVSWLEKEVSIDGIKIDRAIIKKALSEAPFIKTGLVTDNTGISTSNPAATTTPTTAAPPPAAETPAPATAAAPAADTTKKSTKKSTNTPSLTVPPSSADDANWKAWADRLSTTDPSTFTKLAKAMGVKIDAKKRTK